MMSGNQNSEASVQGALPPGIRKLYCEAMSLALTAAANSPDLRTQTGAAVIDSHGEIVAVDHNRFPNGVTNTSERWKEPLKRSLVEHAERNAIFSAARIGTVLEGATLVAPWAACNE